MFQAVMTVSRCHVITCNCSRTVGVFYPNTLYALRPYN